MRRFTAFAALAAILAPAGVTAQTPPPSAAGPAAGYSTADTQIGTLLDDPAAKAVLDRYVPQLAKGEQIDMARGMTLKGIQQYASDMLTDEVLARIDADLAKLPPRK